MNGTGSMTLADLDRDDDLDLIDVTMVTVRVSLNEKGRFTDETAKLGIAFSGGRRAEAGLGIGAAGVLVGDYDNDERPTSSSSDRAPARTCSITRARMAASRIAAWRRSCPRPRRCCAPARSPTSITMAISICS